MFKKLVLRALFSFVVFSFAILGSAKALILPDVYFGVSSIQEQNTLKGNFNNQSIYLEKNSNVIVAVAGIRPITLPIPILGGFRLEGQYKKSLSGDLTSNSYGAVIYYDMLRIIPIVNPYIGIGRHRAKIKYNADNISYNKNEDLFSGHLGVNVSLPMMPLTLFAEYKALGHNFKDIIKKPKNDGNAVFFSRSVVFGARFSIL